MRLKRTLIKAKKMYRRLNILRLVKHVLHAVAKHLRPQFFTNVTNRFVFVPKSTMRMAHADRRSKYQPHQGVLEKTRRAHTHIFIRGKNAKYMPSLRTVIALMKTR